MRTNIMRANTMRENIMRTNIMPENTRKFNVSVNTNIIDKADGPTISRLEPSRKSKVLSIPEIVSNAARGYLQIFCHIKKDSRRVASNVLDSVNLLGFDVDGGMPFSNLDDFFLTHAAAVYTTASHRKPKGTEQIVADRYRILLPLPEPVDRLTAKFLIQRITNTFKYLDPACKDPHRLWFGNTNLELLRENDEYEDLPADWLETAKRQAERSRTEAGEKRRRKDRELEFRAARDLIARRNIARNILSLIPPRRPGANNYDVCRNIVWALCDYVGENVAYDLILEWSPDEINTQSWPVERILEGFDPAFEGVNGSITYRYLYSVGKENGFVDNGYDIRLEELLNSGENDPEVYAQLALMGSQEPENRSFKVIVTARVKTNGICTKGDFKEFMACARVGLEAEGLLPKFVVLKEGKDTVEWVRSNMANRLAYNTQKGHTECDGKHIDVNLFYMSHLAQLNVQSVSKHATSAVIQVAKENSYHPVEKYLLGLGEGPEYPLMDVANKLFKLKCFNSDRQIFKKWLLQCVARALDPGCPAPMCPIILGPQGFGKSLSIRTLAGLDFFRESLLMTRTRSDIPTYLASGWIHEIPEFEQFGYKKQAGEIKELISTDVDESRDVYAREAVTRPRRCCLIGTSNEDSILSDMTGNRRFPVFYCDAETGRPDHKEIERLRDSVWRAAVREYQEWKAAGVSKAPWLLTDAEIAEVSARNKEHVYEADWIANVKSYLEDYQESQKTEPLTARQIFFNADEIEFCRRTGNASTQLGKILRRDFPDWRKHKARVNGELTYRYYSPAAWSHYQLTKHH